LITQYLKKLGYDVPNSEMISGKLNEWHSWYEGKVTSFHNYTQYNGKKLIGRTRKSLCMAKKVCEDWANLLLNEKVDIIINDNKLYDNVKAVLANNNFTVMGNKLIELTFAYGTGAFCEFLDKNKNIRIDYVKAENIFPISWENGKITECAFGCKKRINNEDIIYISIHTLSRNGTYVITNKAIDAKSGNETKCNLEEKVITNSKIPFFQIITPNIINNYDVDSPFGISVFANSIDVLEGIDLVYDSYQNEFRLGKKRIIVPLSMAQFLNDDNKSSFPVFDDNDTEFYAIKANDNIHEIKEINMTLRSDEHEKGLQRNLSLLSSKCGMGNDRYIFDDASVKTATEIISEKSDLYSNLKKHELVLEVALVNLAKAIIELLGNDSSKTVVTVSFDDSIIEDTNAVANRALLELNAEIIDDVEYLMRVYKYSEDAAIEFSNKMKKRQNMSETEV